METLYNVPYNNNSNNNKNEIYKCIIAIKKDKITNQQYMLKVIK